MTDHNIEQNQQPAFFSFWFLGSALLEDDKVFHLVRPADELDDVKSKRGSMKDKTPVKSITEIYLTRLFSMKVNTDHNNTDNFNQARHVWPEAVCA